MDITPNESSTAVVRPVVTEVARPVVRPPQTVYRIRGGKPVRGEISCLGAKNFATKAMVAALLGDTPTTLTNVPPIGDVDITANMLSTIGVRISRPAPNTLRIDPGAMLSANVSLPDSGSNRIPILLLSALLHRFEQSSIPVLGGCQIGERNVDFHLDAIRQFGGTVETTEGGFVASAPRRLHGAHIELPYPSVGATEAFLLLSVLASGSSSIANAAIEPEIIELITMLRSMGAIIFLSGAREIHIEGVRALSGTQMDILGDRIEAASWACLACASDGSITVDGIRPETLGNFLPYYRKVGGGFELLAPQRIRFFRDAPLHAAMIETDVYPGFSTDWQQPFAVLLTQASGVSVIHETVYERRFGYLDTLNKLGANAQMTTHCLGNLPCRYTGRDYDHSALISGPTPLRATERSITIPDLRAGLAYVIAAAIARGVSTVSGVHYLERGYGDIVPRLAALGVDIDSVPAAD